MQKNEWYNENERPSGSLSKHEREREGKEYREKKRQTRRDRARER